MKIIFPLMLGAGLVIPVAEAVPNFNVEPSCKAVSIINQETKLAEPQSFNACMKDEAAAREEMAKTWDKYPAAIRSRCIVEATTGGINSYVDALVCMQMETSVDKDSVTKLKGASKKKQQ